MNRFRENLRDLREGKNLTQKQLATLLGTTDDSIYSWEKGRSQPDIEMICNICIFFEITCNELFGLETQPNGKTNFIQNVIYQNSTHNGDNKF